MKLLFLLLPILYLGGNVYVFVRALQSLPVIPVWAKVVFSIVYWVIDQIPDPGKGPLQQAEEKIWRSGQAVPDHGRYERQFRLAGAA